MNVGTSAKPLVLEPGRRSPALVRFEEVLRSRIVGQDEAVSQLASIYQTFAAGMCSPTRPISNLLFLGPTGSGKTRMVEATAEALLGNPSAFIKVDCAEFQHSHEISKLIGSPPGYIGHRETPPAITQEALTRFYTDKHKLSLLLFDEIEKASDSLWRLLLGILDKAMLTLGDNRKVDFSRTIVFMTSNLGALEMSKLAGTEIGFAPKPLADHVQRLDRKISQVAVDAAKRRFSPEFMNRIDKVVVFRTLDDRQLEQILDLELAQVQQRILDTQRERPFWFHCTQAARAFLLREGTNKTYGARHLKRAIERHLVCQLAGLIATDQIRAGDNVRVDLSPENGLIFIREDFSSPPLSAEGPPRADAPPADRQTTSSISWFRNAEDRFKVRESR
jgi:ATP-dependent Clp protease ATP-binding subunit ClpA